MSKLLGRTLSAGMILAVLGLMASLSGCGSTTVETPSQPDPNKPQPQNGGQAPAPTLKPSADG